MLLRGLCLQHLGSCLSCEEDAIPHSLSCLPLSFNNLGIQCVRKKEIEAAIERKIQLGIDPYNGKCPTCLPSPQPFVAGFCCLVGFVFCLFLFLFLFCFVLFQGRVSLSIPSCPGIHSVD